MKKNIFYSVVMVVIGAIGFFAAASAHAADLTVTPSVIDAKGVPNDILNYSVTVTNTAKHQVIAFASAYELTASGTQVFADPAGSDRPALLVDWISVSRASMTFAPGESKTIPVTIQINPYAAAGKYHAIIGFGEGNTRVDAELNLDGAPQTLVDVDVASNLVASMKVDDFSAAKGFYSAFPVTFNYTLENNGDVSSTPKGQINFYDRLGHNIGSVDANPEAIGIAPGGKHTFTVQWQNGGGFGQYKAVLGLTYGAGDDKLENTALLWVLPWEKLLILFGVLFILMIVAAAWIHRSYEKRHHARRRAIENIIKRHAPAPTPPTPQRDTVIDLRHHYE